MGNGGDSGDGGGGEVACKKLQKWKMCEIWFVETKNLTTPPPHRPQKKKS